MNHAPKKSCVLNHAWQKEKSCQEGKGDGRSDSKPHFKAQIPFEFSVSALVASKHALPIDIGGMASLVRLLFHPVSSENPSLEICCRSQEVLFFARIPLKV